jgi:hypothetical protein
VRERYWVSFQAGEIRSCTSCHGVNATDQAGRTTATNSPIALRSLLEAVKTAAPQVGSADTFSIWSEATLGVPLQPAADDDADGTGNIFEWAMGSDPVKVSSKPVTPLTVSVAQRSGESYAQISFSRTTIESHAAVALEASGDMSSWRTIANFGSGGGYSSDYMLTRASDSATSEKITLSAQRPVSRLADRYFRLRVTAN